ncbi:MerR family transcriptional regulator [Candidatus Aerophobetes bacterium]|nr:MerR family transcriptional regulator [Candidatus Aerophobetes bacterium]
MLFAGGGKGKKLPPPEKYQTVKSNLVEKEKKAEKLYFSIKEVSEETGLPSYTLRFWEKKFPFFSPQKSKGGHRRYQKKDVELIIRIKDLLHSKGFTIEGAKKELKKEKREDNLNIDSTWLTEEIKEIIKLLD